MPTDDALYYNAALHRLAERHRWTKIREATAALAYAVDEGDGAAIQQAGAALRTAFAESLNGPEPARQVATIAWGRLCGYLPIA